MTRLPFVTVEWRMRVVVFAFLLLASASCSRSRDLPKHWSLSISFSSGLCEDTTTNACNTSWSVTESGPIQRTDHFRAGAKTTAIALSVDERKRLDGALRASKFWDGLESKKPCPGEVHDLWVNLELTDVDANKRYHHNITSCDTDKNDYFADVSRLVMRR